VGTSSSTPSPATFNWTAASVGYRDAGVPIDRVIREIWRAAQRESEGNWAQLLAQPIVGSLRAIARSSVSPQDAARLASRAIAESAASSLATDVARRALVQAFAPGDRSINYVQALFSEASNYLVSRDLASFVGPGARSNTVAEAVDFKDGVRARVRELIGDVVGAQTSSEAWPDIVRSSVERLRTA
jgi:hypothetical protein